MLNIPNLLSFLRPALVPVLLYFAWTGEGTLFLVFFACSLLSDIADGYLARRLNQVSDLGAKLDSWCDFTTWMAAAICVWWLWPDLVRREAPYVIAMVASYVVPIIVGFAKYRRMTSYHTWGAKLSAIVVGGGTMLLLLGGAAWPFRLAAVVFVVAEIEEIAITVILPEWRSNVPSLWHAMSLARRSGEPTKGDTRTDSGKL